jgi:outer membrane protein assembly factor BamB
VYFGGDTNFYALDARTGTPLWIYPSGAIADSSPAVANGLVYFNPDDYIVYAFGLKDATQDKRSAASKPSPDSMRPAFDAFRPDFGLKISKAKVR